MRPAAKDRYRARIQKDDREAEPPAPKRPPSAAAGDVELHALTGLPVIERGTPALLADDGRTLVVATGAAVEFFTLQQVTDEPGAKRTGRVELPGRVSALAALGGGRVAAAAAGADGSTLHVVRPQGAAPLAAVPGVVQSLAAAGRDVVAAVAPGAGEPARLLAFDATSGALLRTSPLPAGRVSLSASPDGRHVLVTDPVAGTVHRAGTREDCPPGGQGQRSRGRARPAGEGHDGAAGGDADASGAAPCGCASKPCRCRRCGGGDPHGPGSPGGGGSGAGGSRPPRPRPGEDEDCRPGSGWIPGDCIEWLVQDGTIIRRNRCRDEPDCRTRLAFAAAAITRTGTHIMATSADARRVAFLDPGTLRVDHVRSLHRGGALLLGSPRSGRVVAYEWDRRAWGTLELAEVLDARPALDLGSLVAPAESITFHGHNPEGIPPAPAPQVGTKSILCVPVIEPGQAFTDPDLGDFAAFMGPNAFAPVRDFYQEASFGQMDLLVDLFGHDVGPSGAPIQMPQPFRSYFWPPFEPGGLRAEEASGSNPYDVALDGTESLTVHVVPRQRAEDDLVVPFHAIGFTETYDLFPVELEFDASSAAELEVTDSQGTVWSLTLAFPAETITIQSSDVDERLGDLEAYLEAVLASAESNAGVPGGSPLFGPVEARRVRREGNDFGDLDINFVLNDGPGSAKGSVAVTSFANLGMIGFDDPVLGSFGLGADAGRLDTYLERALRQAESDAGYDLGNRLLGDALVSFAAGTGTLTVELQLSSNDGGDGASMSVASQAGLQALGFDDATPVPGVSNANDANALKESQLFMDHLFSGMVDRFGGPPPDDFFNPYMAILIGIVGAPPAAEWGAAQPDIASLRMFARNLTAKDVDDPDVTKGGLWIGTILDATPDNSTTAHEEGHALGPGDLYSQSGYRDDLQYMGAWCLMGSSSSFSHFCGYNKYFLGWIPPERVVPVALPSPEEPTSAEALLVPVEYWDDGMEAAVEAAFGNGVPVAQLMSIDLGGDGVQFDLVEARQEGVQFSKSLPDGPGVIVTNAIDPQDDTRYAELGLYRRRVHLLNTGNDLENAGDTFDVAAAPELAAVGVSVTVVGFQDVARPGGSVRVFHTRVDREQADYVDLAFTDATPTYKSTDVWVDWAGDNPSDDPDDHRVYPEGTPEDQGEAVHYPSSGKELHWVVARVHNFGTADALNVTVHGKKWDPPGAGDTGNKAIFRTGTIDVVPAGSFVTLPLAWDIGPEENAHQCLRIEIADWDLPEDPVDAIALASDDVWLSNNWAQKNVFDFVPVSASPYKPVDFRFSVTNEGVGPEKAYLEPEALPRGMKLTVTPRVRIIAPGETALFRCTLELDDTVIDPGCPSDREFILWAWRETDEAFERWGGCKYKVRPRHETTATIDGWWSPNQVLHVNGAVVPDPGAGRILLRVAFEGEEATWQAVTLQPGGLWDVEIGAEVFAAVELMSHYEGSTDYAPAYSPILEIGPVAPVG